MPLVDICSTIIHLGLAYLKLEVSVYLSLQQHELLILLNSIMAPSTGSTGTDSNTEWQNNLPRILVVQTIFTFLALLAVGLRLYVRIKLIKNTGADDWTMLIAAVGYRLVFSYIPKGIELRNLLLTFE